MGQQTLQVKGDFDDAMRLVQASCGELDIYLLNSINPFRSKAKGHHFRDAATARLAAAGLGRASSR
jgi:threonine synthase